MSKTPESDKMEAEMVIDYMMNPPKSYSPSALREMLVSLPDGEEKNKVIDHIMTVCSNWTTARMMPKGNIGIVAIHQHARDILELPS